MDRKRSLTCGIEPVPPEKMGEVLRQKARDLFVLCDKEGKGFATKRDMYRLKDQLALTPEQLNEVFGALDKDKNDCLTLEEFTEGLGMFLGIDFQQLHDEEPINSEAKSKPPTEEEEEQEDERFEEFLDQLDARNVFKDEDYIRRMWDVLRKDDPGMLENFESLMYKFAQELKNTKSDFSSLENVLKTRSNIHEEQVRALYAEMEEQMLEEKEALLAKERSKEQKIKNEYESELQLKNQELEDLLSKHTQMEKQLEELNAGDSEKKSENVKLQKERDGLERSLALSEKTLEEMRNSLDLLRKKSLEERRKRAQAALKVSEGIAMERETLVQELHELKKVNKQLLDEKDELVLSATNTPRNISIEDSPPSDSSRKAFPCSLENEMASRCQKDNICKNYDACVSPLARLSRSSIRKDGGSRKGNRIQRSVAFSSPLHNHDRQTNLKEDSIRTAGSSHSGSFRSSCSSTFDEDCEVDENFYQLNPHLVGLPQKELQIVQNNLNLSPPPKPKRSHKDSESFTDDANDVFKRTEGDENAFKFLPSKSKQQQHEENTVEKSQGHTTVKSVVKASSNDHKSEMAPTQKDKSKSPDSSICRVYKVGFVGDSGVGKTSFIHRFCRDSFKPTFNATVGLDIQVKTMDIDGRVAALQLWDTAGQERFRSLTPQYFRKADGLVVVYDVTSETSFKNVRSWVYQVKESAGDNFVTMLIGNKADLCDSDEDRVVKTKHGNKLADEFGALFYETSAKTGTGVIEAMTALSSLLQEKEDENLERVLKLQEASKIKKKRCC